MMRRTHRGIIISINISMMGNFLYAQETNGGSCDACSATPAVIQTYYEFVEEVVGIMSEDYSESSVSPGAPFAGSFTAQGLTLQNSSLFETIYKNNQKRIIENYTFATNTIRVLTKDIRGIIDNATRGMVAMRKPIIKRDIDKIATLDPLIDKLTLSIGRAGLADTLLQDETRQAIEQAVKNRQDILFGEVKIAGATYGNMIRLLNHLQAQIKDALIFTKHTNAINNERLIIQGNSVQIIINDTAKHTIRTSYACVRTQECSANVKKVKDAIGTARSESTKDANNAINDFVMGRKTLKKAFARKGSGNLSTAEEKAIEARLAELRRVNGGGYQDTGSRFNFGFRSNTKEIMDDITTYRKGEEQNKKANQPEYQSSPNPTILTQQRKTNLKEIDNIIRTDKMILTTQFPQDQTQTITESILVMKRIYDTLDIVHDNLSLTCQLQCNNKGGTCEAP